VAACVIMLPILTIFSNVLGIFGGYLVVAILHGVDRIDYWTFSAYLVTSWDVITGLIKAVVFGLLIGLIACFKGFHCEKGAAGVGKAATEAFVFGFIAIIVANFFLAQFLNQIYRMFLSTGAGGLV